MTNEEGRQLVSELTLHFECLNCRRKFDLRRFVFNHLIGIGFYRCECGDNFSFDGPLSSEMQSDQVVGRYSLQPEHLPEQAVTREAISADDVLDMYQFVKKPLKLNLSSGTIRSDNLKL